MTLRPTIGVLALALMASTALGATRVVIDQTLRRAPAERLLGFSSAGLEFETPRGERRRASAERTIGFFVPDTLIKPAPGAGWVDLVTGERIVGEPAELASDGDSVAWRRRDFGTLRLSLENVLRIVPPVDSAGARALPEAPDEPMISDRVTLLNGDALHGFVVSIGEDVTVELESGAAASAALDLVAEIRLANPRGSASGMTLWLADGSVLSAASATTLPGERVEIELTTGEVATIPIGDLLAASFAAERIRALGAMRPESVRIPADRRWSPPLRSVPEAGAIAIAPLFASDVIVPGPMTLRWSMPEGAVRLGLTAELPEASLPWGDCELVIREGGRELARERLWRERRVAEIRVDLSGGPLEIEVDAGRYGPVGDVVRLRAPLLGIER